MHKWSLKAVALSSKYIMNSSELMTSISCSWRTHMMRCITANILQTNADAQCDKLATQLSWQCLRWSTSSSYSELFLSKVTNFNLPHLHLAPPLGVTPSYLYRELWHQKRVHRLSCGIVCMILHFAASVEHRLVTDRETTTAYVVLPWRCAIKTDWLREDFTSHST